jgi:hypothetical protein
MRVGSTPPLLLDCTVRGWCRCCPVCIFLLQLEEKVASKELGLAVVETRRGLTRISLYVSGKEGGRYRHRPSHHQIQRE